MTEQKPLSEAQRAKVARQPVMTAEDTAALAERVRANREANAAESCFAVGMPTNPEIS